MKTAGDIQGRIRFLLSQELDRRLSTLGQRLPYLCVHNYQHPLDVRKTVDGDVNDSYNRITKGPVLPVVQTIGLCMLGSEDPKEWGGTICEEPIDAQRCPYFNPKHTKRSALEDLRSQVNNPEWLRLNMPEVYGLMWTLDQSRTPQVPWWKRLLFWATRVRPEPLRMEAGDPTTRLLGPGSP